MKLKTLSASSFKTYSECEYKWWLNYTLGFRGEGNAAALMGSIYHHVFEILSKLSMRKRYPESKYWDIDYLFRIAFNHYSKKEPKLAAEIDFAKFKKITQGALDLIHDPNLSPVRNNIVGVEKNFRIEIKEKGFELPDGSYFGINGFIDRVDLIEDGFLQIVDYKSGSRVLWSDPKRRKKVSKDLFDDIQPRMYHLAAKYLYPECHTFLINFIYFSDGGSVAAMFFDQDIEETKMILKQRLKAMLANEKPQRTKGWHCTKLCDFGKSGLCDLTWAEVMTDGYKKVEEKYKNANNKV